MSFYLTQSLHRALRQYPDRLATICGARQQNFRRLGDRVARFASALQSLGLKPGDRVAMLALNSDRVVEQYLATFWAGGVASPLNIRWNKAEIIQGIRGSGASLLLVDDSFVSQGLAAALDIVELRQLIYLGDGPIPSGMLSYEALIESHEPIEDQHRNGEDLAFVLYTGGTTGAPKGVMLSHSNLSTASLGTVAMCGGLGAIYLHAPPLFHMAGLQIMFCAMIAGATHVLMPAFDPALVLETIERERPSDVMFVPTMLQMLIDHPDARRRDLSSLKRIFYGASPISEAVLDRAMAALPGTGFVQGYGMSESGITLVLTQDHHTEEGRKRGKLRSAGAPAPAAEVKIVDENGVQAPCGTPGEILVRGPTVMQGYWQQPQLTAQTIREGWLHTGDVGYMDEEGFVFIVDRLKDMIVSGGENVYSTEVENALSQHPAVAYSAVIGVPDHRWGERVHAIVVLKPGAESSEQALIAHCKQHIASYKCPRSIEFRSSLPMSAAGKILKNELRLPYWKGQTRGVA